jgi:hypothetical protein
MARKKRMTSAEIQKLLATRRRRSEAAQKREAKKRKLRAQQETSRKSKQKRPPWAYPSALPEQRSTVVAPWLWTGTS